MSLEIQEALTIAGIGTIVVFSSLTLLIFLLFILNRLLNTQNAFKHSKGETSQAEEPYSQTNNTEPKESSPRDLNQALEEKSLTPEDKELEEVAVIAAIAAIMGVSFAQPKMAIETPIYPPQPIHLWRVLGRQKFIQSQGVMPRTWKR